MAWRELKQRLYRGGRPGRLARWINRAFAELHGRGLGPASWVTLEVVGRRSGRTISFPLVMARLDGERYLVSMLGCDAAWVHNVRASKGHAVLRHGQEERVRLEELAVERRARVLKTYLAAAPGARPHFPVDEHAALEAFEAIAAGFPVFRVVTAD